MFFVGAIAALVLAGVLVLATGRGVVERLLGAGAGIGGILALASTRLQWLEHFGMTDVMLKSD